ncbi:putative ABC transporter permease [Caldibacillus lycopersici]|uniref:ABC transporter permease n=1 Tax=Perspicuibacillus lycopersici TaxID=1325689 RepID=A0AAE3IV46_9BACI|nr:putative ABC transporter permease [Perspicuibacillus lycopersici]MCU9615022.1 putative ABC transporter permease [Perspicuibacillus lycopersici]
MSNWVDSTNVFSLLFFFMIYACLGWLLENTYNYIINRKFVKDNFFIGPFKPMYGFAPILLLLMLSPNMHLLTVLMLYLVIPTIIEYVSGWLLFTFFRRKYWDYSKQKFQLHGHICLPFSICWMVLSYACLHWLHLIFVMIYGKVDFLWPWMAPFVMIYLLAELIFAIRRNLLIQSPANEPNPVQ